MMMALFLSPVSYKPPTKIEQASGIIGMKLFSYLLLVISPFVVVGQDPNFPLTANNIRSLDGSDGNPGAQAGATLRRRSGYFYTGDGSGTSIRKYPNVRTISNRCVRQPTKQMPNKRSMSDFIWAWGQFLDHDIDLTPADEGAGTAHVKIKSTADRMGHGTEMEFKRALFDPNSGKPGRPREHINIITSVIDGSVVYGSDKTRADFLRSFEGGFLRTYQNETMRSRVLPPLNTGGFANEGNDRFNSAALFIGGDLRANEQLTLTALHSLFIREHNRLCRKIAELYPIADDEQIYQLARKLVGMEIQKITYEDWLPTLLGPMAPRLEDYRGYDENIDVGIAAEFSGAAFRFGHSMLSSKVELVRKDGMIVRRPLRRAFFNHEFLKQMPFRVDMVIQGLTRRPSQEIDPFVIEDARSFLFGDPGKGGLDLAATNIQRGRDLGLPKYNVVREAYNLTRKTSFADISSSTKIQAALDRAYGGKVDDLDLWVGCVAEDHVEGASVGELLGTILADQFDRLMHGDKWFYLNDPDLKKQKLQGLMSHKKMRLSNIVGLNTYFNPRKDSNVFLLREGLPTAS